MRCRAPAETRGGCTEHSAQLLLGRLRLRGVAAPLLSEERSAASLLLWRALFSAAKGGMPAVMMGSSFSGVQGWYGRQQTRELDWRCQAPLVQLMIQLLSGGTILVEAEEYGLPPEKVFIGGFDQGGVVALAAALLAASDGLEPFTVGGACLAWSSSSSSARSSSAPSSSSARSSSAPSSFSAEPDKLITITPIKTMIAACVSRGHSALCLDTAWL